MCGNTRKQRYSSTFIYYAKIYNKMYLCIFGLATTYKSISYKDIAQTGNFVQNRRESTNGLEVV